MLNIKKKIDIAPYLTMKMKCIAEKFLICESREDIINAVKHACQNNIPLTIIGGGSNVVPKFDFIKGLVLVNRYQHCKTIFESNKTALLEISGGYLMSRIVKETVERGLSGFEYHYGLPGTIGGAIAMNSKWVKTLSYVSDGLQEACLIGLDGVISNKKKDYFAFSYGYSILQDTKEIFLEGKFLLHKKNPEDLKKIMYETHDYRVKSQPHGVFTCGCFFKNISEADRIKTNLPTRSTGYLIDKSGLKGLTIGGFSVSEKHANFIVNNGKGTYQDLKTLIDYIKKRIYDLYQINLKEEVCSI